MGTTGQSITLANSIIGVGILAMPFCFQQCGVLLASLILLLMGLISRLCCYFLLKSALIARRRNFEFLAFHVFGSAGKLLVELGIIGFLMGTCIAYFVVVGDLGPQIIAKMFNINQSDILRTSIMVLVSLLCVLPLGLLRNVDSLSNVSAATIGFYFCLVMRVITEGASQLVGGEWGSRVVLWRPAGVLQCVPIFSMALFCQTQLFEIFESMPTLSLEKMNVVTKNAINICTGVYFTLGLFGYIAFCTQTISGNILMSLSPTMTSDVIKLGFVMSLAFSFPLIIFPCRASLYSFLYKKVHSSQHDHIINHSIPAATFRCITVAIIAVTLFISLLIPNIELVLGLLGSTIGVLICIVFPCACFINVTFKNTNERVLAKAVLVLGLFILVLGTYANLEAAEKNHDRYDEKYLTQLQIDKMLEDFVQKQGVQMKAVEEKEVKMMKIDIHEESEVQPPNPVPPNLPSNEKVQNNIDKLENKIKDILPDDKEKQVLSKSKEVEQVNKDSQKTVVAKVEDQIKDSGIIAENESNNIKDVKKDQDKAPVEDKLDIMKQQHLIETIKQHGEEQKELIKEQKLILDKIKQTKNELQQNKKDVGSEEAKKIAVESIQKIANMAIKSLSGVTDNPPAKLNNEASNLEKIANDAVQDIAQKVVESMHAIDQEKKEIINANNPVPINNNGNVPVAQNLNPVPLPNIPQTNQLINNNQLLPNQQRNYQQVQNAPNFNQNVKPEANIGKNINGIPNDALPNGMNINQANMKLQTTVNNNGIPENNNINVNHVANNAPADKLTNDVNIPISNGPIASQLGQNVHQVKPNVDKQNIPNEHSHSPDEPQSYKQGEDTQKQKHDKVSNSDIIHKVPLPVAMNGNQIYKDIANHQNANEQKIKLENVAINNNLVRNKREALDCSQVSQLKHEDRQICDALSKNSGQLPLDLDISDVALTNRLPLEVNAIHRSLKSYNEDEIER